MPTAPINLRRCHHRRLTNMSAAGNRHVHSPFYMPAEHGAHLNRQDIQEARASREMPSDALRWVGPYRDLLAVHRKQRVRPLHAIGQPPSIPNPHHNSLPRSSHRHLHTVSKPTPIKPTHATSSPRLATQTPPQASKQSPVCVRNIAWNGKCLPRP